MKWDGPPCECGHPMDLHWALGNCRVRGCECRGPGSHSPAVAQVLDAVPPADQRRAERRAPTAPREKDWQQAVMDLARLRGWLCYHTHDSRRSEPGFPDLVMVRGDRVLYRELKREGNKPTAEQRRWIDALWDAGQDVAVWTLPRDWDDVVAVLA